MIKAFQHLYKGRKSIDVLQTEEQVRQVIQSELLDEYTHPRARQSIEKKYALALERIDQSQLPQDQKQLIKEIYKEEYKILSTEDRM
ncbi:hypothetical protein [Bacillus sp. FJAT-22090]|uniref:hypothetical protein n=1 Tax=Bacillus sp. FJAT-22090 TaxID=1581038 RepID=UPI0011A2F65D|nr:hypothetical protein [Bacillus sp. FJAT-22090]